MNKPYKKGNVGRKKTIIKGDNGVQNKTKAFDGEKKNKHRYSSYMNALVLSSRSTPQQFSVSVHK